jgi:NAD(P)H-nitrite reductase large subunit
MSMQHVVIGAGPAGVIAAETLRKLDPQATITLIGDEPEPPYSRMAIPYFLIKQIEENGTHLRKDAEHFRARGIALIQGRVSGINRVARELSLDGGTSIAYDKLLIATGSRPATPPVPGIDLPGVTACWTLADARRIAATAKPGARVVLMGAGFIGCIILEALARSGATLTVVEMADRMVPRMMNDVAGNLIKDWCGSRGVMVHTSTQVAAIERDGTALRVVLSNGQALGADLVVSATGVRPNLEFAAASGLATDHGILVDRHLATNDPLIHAAGDVAQGIDFSTGEYSVQAIQPTAADHAQLAARNMAGLAGAVHRGCVNMNVLDTLGLISSSFGLWMGKAGGESSELLNRARYRYLNLQFEDDVLVGATSLGLTQHVGVLRGLIQSRTRLGAWKKKLVDDPTRIMEAYLASTQALGFNAGVLK